MSKIFGIDTRIAEQNGILEKNASAELYSLFKRLKEYSAETFEHSVAVSELSGRLGVELGYGLKDIARLNMAGMLHDIGKLSVPLQILHKQGELNEEEWHEMQKHPEAGYKMILPYVNDVAVLLAVRQHHEHLDGSGYPDGISGGITEFTKIITLADVYDGLTRKRSYRLSEISAASAKQIMFQEQARYDKEYLTLFFEYVVQGGWKGERVYV